MLRFCFLIVLASGCGEVLLRERDAGPDASAGSDAAELDAAMIDASASDAEPAGPFLVRVRMTGDGDGRVISGDGAIDCPARCEAMFASGSVAMLEGTASETSVFEGWFPSAVCSGAGRCVFEVSGDVEVTAAFSAVTYRLNVTIAGSGAGAVRSLSAGIDCGERCVADLRARTRLLLEADAERYSRFIAWGGACSGSAPTCELDMNEPKAVSAEFAVQPQIFAGGQHSCAVLQQGNVRCWGRGSQGRLGYDDSSNIADGVGPSIAVAGDVPIGGSAVSLALGGEHTCALISTGAVRCWGSGSHGQLGYGSAANIGDGAGISIIAAGDLALDKPVLQLAAGSRHTCALVEGGDVHCWGSGSSGQLGYGERANVGDGIGWSIDQRGPVALGGQTVQIAAGGDRTCAVLVAGTVRCWGYGQDAGLGYGTSSNVADGIGPSIVSAGDVPTGGTVVDVAVAESHICARLDRGEVRCWGAGDFGRLGYGDSDPVGGAGEVSIIAKGDVPVGLDLIAVATGGAHTCGVSDLGTVRCWGYNYFGQLGHPHGGTIGGAQRSIQSEGDVAVGATVRAVALGGSHTCALLASDAVRCWGEGAFGVLGYNSGANVSDPYAGITISEAGDVPLY